MDMFAIRSDMTYKSEDVVANMQNHSKYVFQ